ncbi:hypothetical protein [Noviherbaspirillum sp.]|uniref:hypothetical protein n=1 Tax=Noviherbaspirillum sp. TaxID=1926288 RepID=UPI002FE17084
MQQLEEAPPNPSRQEGAPHLASASSSTLSVTELNRVNRVNQALLEEFRQKADANPDNTPLTKDYCHDVLVELADWLKQQSAYPGMHSLPALVGFACDDNRRCVDHIAQNLDKHFTDSGAAPVQMGKPSQLSFSLNMDLGHIISALSLSRREPHITLPPAVTTRQDEWLLHTHRFDLIRQGSYSRTAINNIAGCRHFCIWLQQQKLIGTRILHGLDSLEKVLNFPNENQVKEVVESFRNDPGTTTAIGEQARTGINKLRMLKGQSPIPVRKYSRARPMHQQLLAARPEQPATLAPPHTSRLGSPAFMAEAAALPSTASNEAGSSRFGVWRPVPRSQDASRYVRPHAGTVQPGQTTNIAPSSNPGASGPVFMAEAAAFPDAASDEAGSRRYGVWRPVPASQDASRNVRRRVDPAPPGQTTNIVPTHSPSVTGPAITDEEIAFLVAPPTSEEEFDFFNKMFK